MNCIIQFRITVHSAPAQATVMLYQKVGTAHVDGIKHVNLSAAGPQPRRSFISFSTSLFAMLQLRGLALLLVALSGSASAAIGPGATLPIVNANIAPDGFPRV